MISLRHALRSIRRMPALAAVVVLSLGAGIGVNTVVFSWIQSRVLEPLPGVRDGFDLHLVEPRTANGLYPGASWPEYRDLRDGLRTFDALIAFRMTPVYVGEPGQVERAYGQLVSDNYFEALGLHPHLGRFPMADEMAAGGSPVAVISYDCWRTRFAADPNVTTRSVRVNGRPMPIVGVAHEAFQGTVMGVAFDLWLPAALSPDEWRSLEARSARGFSVMGRLAPGATAAAARAELAGVMGRLAAAFPQTNATVGAEVLRIWQPPRGPQRMLTAAVALLQALMLLLLLAVCGNAATLVLARASARQREMGIRFALGATPRRVFALLLTENMVLALAGAALGAAIAVWGTEALRAGPMIRGVPLKFQTSIDGTGLAVAAGLGVLCGLLVGLAPALQLGRAGAQLAGRTGAAPAGRHELRLALMGIQVGLALVVLVVAAIAFRSFLEARGTDPGFRREGVLLATYDFAGRRVSGAVTRAFAATLLDALRALPALDSAAIATSVPLDIHGMPSLSFRLEGRARPDVMDQALTNTVTSGYFDLMRIPILAGTDFAPLADDGVTAQAIVNEEFVRRYLDGGQAPGRRLEVRGRTTTIVGVTGNSLYNAFGEPAVPIIYLSYRDWSSRLGEIHLRVRAGSESAIAPEVRRVVRTIDPELPLFNVRTLTEHVEANLVFRRIPARIFAVLAPLLLALTSMGIYAIVAYTVSLRTTEIGVRMALGARPPQVVRQLVGESLAVAATGGLAGWTLAFIGARNFASSRSADLAVFAGVPVVLLAVAALACWLPARRAARVDPAAALRAE